MQRAARAKAEKEEVNRGRLALFALISQPVYALNADPSAFWENLTNWNIFFILVLSLLFMWRITHRRWYGIGTAVLSLAALCIWNFDYFFTQASSS